MHLLAFMMPNPASHALLSWTDPSDQRADRMAEPAYWQELAKTFERGRLDGVFIADAPFFQDTYGGSLDLPVRYAIGAPAFDPIPLVTLMASATRHLGLAVTLSTQHPPYFLVRTLGTLDNLSAGRIGWNIVTDFNKNLAQNLGLDDLLSHDERYRRADEYMDVCYALWDSWEPDAVVRDKESRVWADPRKVHRIDFEGEFLRCVGPSIVGPSPQGRPVLFQAGSSPRGREFAARHAEVAFSIQRSGESMRKYSDDMRKRVLDQGRDPEGLRLMFGVMPIVGDSAAHAQERYEELVARMPVEAAVCRLSAMAGIDMVGWDLDEPLADMEVDGVQGLIDIFTKLMPGRNLTLREAATSFGFSLGMPLVLGTASEVADQLEAFHETGGGDGFNVSVPTHPVDFERFVDEVVPELQRRGSFRTDYGEGTFRDRFQRATAS